MVYYCGDIQNGLKDISKEEGFQIKQEKYDCDDIKQEAYNYSAVNVKGDLGNIKLEEEIEIEEETTNNESLPHKRGSPFQVQNYESSTLFCKVCKKTFFSKINLTAHQNYGQCKQKPYSCHLCKRSYCEMEMMLMHQIIVHGSCKTITTYLYENHNVHKPLLMQSKKRRQAGSKHTHSKQNQLKSQKQSLEGPKHNQSKQKLSQSKKHSQADSIQKLVSSDNEPKCFICNRVFDSKYNLNYHERYSLIHSHHVVLQRFKK